MTNEPGDYGWLGWGRMATEPLTDDPRRLADCVEPLTTGNGKPEPAPYRYQGRPGWEPSQVAVCRNDFEARQHDQGEWATANAELVERIRSKLAKRAGLELSSLELEPGTPKVG